MHVPTLELKCDFLTWSSQWRLVGELADFDLGLLAHGIAGAATSRGFLLLFEVDNSSNLLAAVDFDLGVKNSWIL